MHTDTCVNCGKPIYFGPRIKTRPNDGSRLEKIWRHVDTEHRKCVGTVPHAWPKVLNKRVP